MDESFYEKPVYEWDISKLGFKLKSAKDMPKFDPASIDNSSYKNPPKNLTGQTRFITPQYSHTVYDENGERIQVSKTGQFVKHTIEGEDIIVYGNKPLMGECNDDELPFGLQIKTNTLFNTAQYAGKGIKDIRDYFFDCVKKGEYKKAKLFLDPIASKYKNSLESLIHDALSRSPWGSLIGNVMNNANNAISNWVTNQIPTWF